MTLTKRTPAQRRGGFSLRGGRSIRNASTTGDMSQTHTATASTISNTVAFIVSFRGSVGAYVARLWWWLKTRVLSHIPCMLSIGKKQKNEKSFYARFALILQGFRALRPRRKRRAPKNFLRALSLFGASRQHTESGARRAGRTGRDPSTPVRVSPNVYKGFRTSGRRTGFRPYTRAHKDLQSQRTESKKHCSPASMGQPCPTLFCFLPV